jgi:hypothetical protein
MTLNLCSRILVAAAVVAVAVSASAQTSSGVLNTLEVQRLVAADTPAAHASLGKHFVALADTFRADVARYTALSSAFTGNPNHTFGVDPGARRSRQAKAAAQLAESARAMATYHHLLSLGAAPAAPPDRAAFDGGAGATVPTRAELDQFALSARTRSDHRTLEEYFLTVAHTETANADTHTVMAQMARVSGARNGATDAAAHCDRLVKLSREAASEASAAVELHRQLTDIG